MLPLLAERFGNPSGAHAAGPRGPRRPSTRPATSWPSCLGCRPGEVVFTGGGTEADNLAVARRPSRRRAAPSVCIAVEHHAVLAPGRGASAAGSCAGRRRRGRSTSTRWPPRSTPTSRVVSVMLANNEVGTIQPLADVAAVGRATAAPGAVAPHRRGAGRAVARRRRGWPRRADLVVGQRPQVRRAQGRRRARRARRASTLAPLAARRRPGAGAAQRHPQRGRHRRPWPPRPRPRADDREADRRAGRRAARPAGRRPAGRPSPGAVETGSDGDRARSPGICHVCFAASRARRCCSCSTRPACAPRRRRRARAAPMEPSHVLAAMGVPDGAGRWARCACRSARRTTDADVDRALEVDPRRGRPARGRARDDGSSSPCPAASTRRWPPRCCSRRATTSPA